MQWPDYELAVRNQKLAYEWSRVEINAGLAWRRENEVCRERDKVRSAEAREIRLRVEED